jgi:hypothetical protein
MGIAREYFKNYSNKDIIMTIDSFDDDNNQRVEAGVSNTIEELAQRYSNRFFKSRPNMKIMKTSASMNGVGTSNLESAVSFIVDEQKIDDVLDIYRAMFHLYINDPEKKADITNLDMRFVASMDNIYRKANSKDINVIRIKDILTRWLEDATTTSIASNRLATQNSFKKAIFMYLVFIVAYNE